MTDYVRVFRIIEYTGPRDWVEELISKSVQGEKIVHPAGMLDKGACRIRATTIGNYAEIVAREDSNG